MNGWFALGILAIISLAILVWNVRSSKGLWQIAAAVVLLGMTAKCKPTVHAPLRNSPRASHMPAIRINKGVNQSNSPAPFISGSKLTHSP